MHYSKLESHFKTETLQREKAILCSPSESPELKVKAVPSSFWNLGVALLPSLLSLKPGFADLGQVQGSSSSEAGNTLPGLHSHPRPSAPHNPTGLSTPLIEIPLTTRKILKAVKSIPLLSFPFTGMRESYQRY